MENLVDRGAWQATVPGVAESGTTEATSHTSKILVPIPLVPEIIPNKFALWKAATIDTEILIVFCFCSQDFRITYV